MKKSEHEDTPVSEQDWELVGQLLLAAILSGILGYERQRRERPAGLRTYMLVAVAAACFTQVGMYALSGVPRDPTRVAAQVVTGVGFLGAGAIWRSGLGPRGLTTAAGLWISAAVGMLAAARLYAVAVAATALAWLILWGGFNLEQRLGIKREGAPAGPEEEANGAGEQAEGE